MLAVRKAPLCAYAFGTGSAVLSEGRTLLTLVVGFVSSGEPSAEMFD